jgi:drug/metabolite transporter (DMT)-like permease
VLFAFVTTFLFAASSVLAHKSQQAVGPARANLGRLGLGVVFLGAWAYLFGQGHGGPALGTFLLSGLAGMGIGDLAFFAALPFLGSRLTTTMNQCLSVPIAIGIEWLWLGQSLSGAQLAWIALILSGIVIALAPTRRDPPKVRVRTLGIVLGIVAAAGQGIGAVLSRHGFEVAAAAGQQLDGLTAAYQRLLGGLALTLVWFAAKAWIDSRRAPAAAAPVAPPPLRAHGWIVIHALAGPVVGMGTFQLALASAPSGLVLPITACAPLAVIPLAYWLEGERPSKRSLLGGAVAVAGAVALALAA